MITKKQTHHSRWHLCSRSCKRKPTCPSWWPDI